MNKLLILIPAFLFCVFNSKAQTNVYHPFPDSNAVWNISYYGAWSGCWENCSYTINGDTVIGAYTYHKLLIPYLQRGGTCTLHPLGYNGCIRQDTSARMVYFMAPDSTTEEVLYNFNLQVGDSVFGITRFGCYSIPRPITQIDSILIGNNYRKRWKIASSSFSENSLIEGIGFTCGLLERCAINAVDLPYFWVTCFQQNGTTLFPDTNTNCLLIDVQSEISNPQSEILLSPNPTSSTFTITTTAQPQNAQVEIYNVVGVKMYSAAVNLKLQTFNLKLAPGIYFIKLQSDEGSAVQKLIVQ